MFRTRRTSSKIWTVCSSSRPCSASALIASRTDGFFWASCRARGNNCSSNFAHFNKELTKFTTRSFVVGYLSEHLLAQLVNTIFRRIKCGFWSSFEPGVPEGFCTRNRELCYQAISKLVPKSWFPNLSSHLEFQSYIPPESTAGGRRAENVRSRILTMSSSELIEIRLVGYGKPKT